jgi:hypothetical protein
MTASRIEVKVFAGTESPALVVQFEEAAAMLRHGRPLAVELAFVRPSRQDEVADIEAFDLAGGSLGVLEVRREYTTSDGTEHWGFSDTPHNYKAGAGALMEPMPGERLVAHIITDWLAYLDAGPTG